MDRTNKEAFRFYRADGFRLLEPVVRGLAQDPAMSAQLAECVAQRAQGEAMDALLLRLIAAELQRLALLGPEADSAVRAAGQLDPGLSAWFDATCRMLALHGLARADSGDYALCADFCGDLDTLRARWREMGAEWTLMSAHWRLADAVLSALADILHGRRAATGVLFPEGSLARVEGVYCGNPISDHFNGLVAASVRLAADAARAAGRRLRILEIGAGTGGTSRVVLERLREAPEAVAEYCYTDVSKAFLLHAREHYGAEHAYLRTVLFDVERDFAAQQLEGGVYDIVIATNVLHATRNIRRTLRNAKGLLRNGGLLILNEMSATGGAFTHLTFGLTPGWWLFEDGALRLPDGPALDPTGWETALRDEGFPGVGFPARAHRDFGLQLVLAESDGMVRGVRAEALPASPPPSRALASQAPEPETAVADPVSVGAGRERSATARLGQVRQVILEELRYCLMLDDLPDSDEAFADLGLDSIVGVTFIKRINDRLRIALDHNATFDHSNAVKLARHALAEHAPQLAGPPDRNPDPQPAPAAGADRQARGADPSSASVDATRRDSIIRAPEPGTPLKPRTETVSAAGPVAMERIAIIGMSGVFARSADLAELWEHLAAGTDLVVPFPQRGATGDGDPDPAIVGGFLAQIDEFDALFFAISGQEATYMDPQQRLFLQECWRALENAGYAGGRLDGVKCGVYVGGAAGDYPALFGDDYAPQALWGNLGSLIASRISYFLNLRGPALVIDTACSSSLVSVHLACQALSTRDVDSALAGGVFMLSTSNYFAALQRAGMFSPSGRCHAFDDRADGFVPAEGAGVVLLKRLAEAIEDGDCIHGVIRGSGVNQDGASNGITAPSAASQEALETSVYQACGLNPRQIQMVEAHGTGTILGDPIEHSALSRTFRKYTDDIGFCALGSIKTNLGHAQSAAGIAGILKVLLSLRHRKMPPSLNFGRRNPNIDFDRSPFFVNTALRDWPENRDQAGNPIPRCAVVSSFGISGTNAHLVIEEALVAARRPEPRAAYLAALSARTGAELRHQAERLLAHCVAEPDLDCGNLCFTLLTGRKHFGHRLACVVRDCGHLVDVLRAWLGGEKANDVFESEPVRRGAERGGAFDEYAERCVDACRTEQDSSRYPRLLVTVAELHVQGHRLDFEALFEGGQYSRLPLLTYPLLRDRYWVPAQKREPAAAAPAVGRLRNTSTLDEQRFSARFDPALEAERRWLSAAAVPALMRQALSDSMAIVDGGWRLHDLRWGEPLERAPADGACELHLGLYRDAEDSVLLELYRDDGSDGERTIHAQARAELDACPETGGLNLGELRAGLAETRSGAWIGPGVWLVGCPAGMDVRSVLDRLVVALGRSDPIALERLEGRGDWSDAQWLWIRVSGTDRIDADVCAADGAVVGRVTGLTYAQTDAAGWLLLGGEWQARPLPASTGPWRGAARSLVVVGGGDDRYRALRERLLGAGDPQPIDSLHVQNLSGAGFVDACSGLLELCRDALAERLDDETLIQVLIWDTPAAEALAAGLAGFLRSAHREHPMLRGQVVRMPVCDADEAWRRLERDAADEAVEIRHDASTRLVRVLRELPAAEPSRQASDSDADTAADTLYREGGRYLITGGAGEIGLQLAESLARRLRCGHLILTGRSSLDDARAQRLAAVRSDAFEVEYRAVAVDDAEAMRALMAELATQGGLNGIVHAAGLIRDSYMIHKSSADAAAVLSPKVVGAELLDVLSRDFALDFFVAFASITGEFGNAGQVDYAAANAYLRGFAEHRNALVARGERRGRTLSIDWPLWRNGGMRIDETTAALLRQRGLEPLETEDGLDLLWSARRIDAAHVVALYGDVGALRPHFMPGPDAVPPVAAAPVSGRVSEHELRAQVERRLVDLLAAVAMLPASRIDVYDPLEGYGIDSVMVTELNAALDTAFGALSKTLLYEYRTLADLAGYLCAKHAGACEAWCGFADLEPQPAPVRIDAPRPRAVLASIASRFRSGNASDHREPIAIIGIAGRYPGAADLDAFWENLRTGTDAVGEIPPDRWDVARYQENDVEAAVERGRHYTRSGGFLEGFADFDPLFFRVAPADAYDLNPQERIFIESCWATLEDAGYSPDRIARRHRGRVGVFAGITKNGYELHGPAMWSRGERGYPHTSFGSVANRVSYILNLNGPSMPIDTMCSASLTAIHEACEHLYRDECELALAGGVNLYLHPSNYVMLCAQRMLSPTGRCHSFGALGDGFIPGEGVGTVLLKRLSAAKRDGDPIRAVIRGTAINHGGKTNGYTVPNPAAQAELVRAALDRAGASAREISFIEAHGTGTRLGDPIEIAGLQQAFSADTQDCGFCAIGSLKSNIGHLEAAAGIAGLTKIVLQMEHGQIAPSLHAETINPNIDFARTPFHLQRELGPWRRPVLPGRRETPRLAGVSGFGAGGSNAHVLVEEYIATEAVRPPLPGPYPIVLSARNEERLREVVARLARALEGREDAQLADIAYTLQVGRDAMEERLALQVRTLEQLRDSLRRYLAGDSVDGLYRGQVQRNREALSLFDNDEDLREAVANWLEKGKYDRLLGLWVKGLTVDWESAYGVDRPRCIRLPTYPFARERYWLSPSVAGAPQVAVVGERTRLHPLVHENVSLFSRQAFRSAFDGDEGFLADHVIQGRRVLPGVAYLEMAREAIARSLDDGAARIGLRDVVWLRPIVAGTADAAAAVEVSIVLDAGTGAEIGFEIGTVVDGATLLHCRGIADIAGEASQPAPTLDLDALRGRCLRHDTTAAAFYAGLADAGMVYGPHQQGVTGLWNGRREILAQLQLPPAAALEGYRLHPSLLDAALQATVALAWAEPDSDPGAAMVPFALDAVSIPGDCETRMWAWIRAPEEAVGSVQKLDIDLCDDAGNIRVALRGLAARRLRRGDGIETRFHAPAWRPAALPMPASGPQIEARNIVFCGWDDDRVAATVALLPGARCHVVAVADDAIGRDPAALFERCVLTVHGVIRDLAGDRTIDSALLQVVVPDDGIGLEGLSGLLLTASAELPSIACQQLRFPATASAPAMAVWLSEAAADPSMRILRFDADGARQRHFEARVPDAGGVSPWREQGVYWITGGAGGLGLLLAREIVERVPGVTLVLSGRRPESAAIAAELAALRMRGARAEYHAIDVVDADALRPWLQALEQRVGPFNGIVHAAGELRDAYLVHKDAADLRAVMSAKVAGLVALDEATRGHPLDFMVLCSSLAGAYGNPGQSDYAAANAFMDAFAAHRNRRVAAGERSGRTVSIGWPLWADGGMRANEAVERMMRERYGLESLDTASGIAAFYRALADVDADQIVVLHGRLRAPSQVADTAPPARASQRSKAIDAAQDERPAMAPPAATDRSDAGLHARAEAYLVRTLAQALKMPAERVDPHAPLENYGIDSIKVMDLTFALEKHFGPLSKTLFFEYQTIAELTRHFVRRHPQRLAELVGSAPGVGAAAAGAQASPGAAAASRLRVKNPMSPAIAAGAAADTASEPRETGGVAIVGLSGRYPMADDLDAFWDNLRSGRDCVSEIPLSRWDHALFFDDAEHPRGKTYCRWGGFLDGVADFDPLFFKITPLEASYVDPQERIFLQCAFATLEDAGYTREDLRRRTGGRVGVYVGVMYEEYPLFGAQAQTDGKRVALTGSPSSIANRVSYFCNFNGPSMAVDSMCSSSLTTLHLACQSLRLGECEAAIAGGVNVSIHPNKYILLEQGHFASSNGRCESFGRGGDGYVPGEGVGAVLLKTLAQAQADGDHIHGVIRGTAVNHGGKTNGYTVPNPNAQGAVVADALKAAGIDPSWISYVEAHGTGTSLGDPIEIAGLGQAYEGADLPLRQCPIGSVKSNIGHCESAAGIAGLTKVLLQMRHGLIAPSLHSDVLNPGIDFAASPFFVPQTAMRWERPHRRIDGAMRELPRIAGISSFGAGGSNAHVIVEEPIASAPRSARAAAAGPQAIVLSARTRDALEARARQLLQALRSGRFEDADLGDIAYTLQSGRETMAVRAGIVVATLQELVSRLQEIVDGHPDARISETQTVYRAPGREGPADAENAALSVQIAGRDPSALVDAWLDGTDVPWAQLHRERSPRRVALPTYPFERKPYWLDMSNIPAATPFAARRATAIDRPAPATPGTDAHALVRIWRDAPLPPPQAQPRGELVLLGTTAVAGLCAEVASGLPGWDVRTVMHGVDADFLSAESCEAAFARFDGPGEQRAHLIDLTALDREYERSDALECGKLRLLQRFVERHARDAAVALQIVHRLADFRTPVVTLQGARTVGLYRALGAEYPRLHARSIDTDLDADGSGALAQQIVAELLEASSRQASTQGTAADARLADICHRNGARYLAAFERRALPSAPMPSAAAEVALIAGGTGGLGAAVAEHLAAAGATRFVIFGRDVLPPQERWPDAIAAAEDPQRRLRLRRLQSLVDGGAQVRYSSVPLSDADALRREIARIEAQIGAVTAVYHCSGSSGANPAFVKKPAEEMLRVCAPKMAGLRALDAALSTHALDRFVLFSSVAGAIPMLGAGQADYALANAYMDQYAVFQRRNGRPFQSIQWPLWSGIGMGAHLDASAAYLGSGLSRIDRDTGMALLDRVRMTDHAVVLPLGGDGRDVDTEALLRPAVRSEAVRAHAPASVAAVETSARRTAIAAWLRGIFIAEFGLPASELSDDRPFVDYGVDSIFIVQATSRMQRESAGAIDPALLFEYDTLGKLADHLDRTADFDSAFLTAADPRAGTEPTPAPSRQETPVAVARIAPMPDAPGPGRGSAIAPDVPVVRADDIAVVGLACRLPGARDRAQYWRLLSEGGSAIRPVPATRWPAEGSQRYLAGWVDDIALFDYDFFGVHRDDARIMDPQARLVLEESLAALCDAGYAREELSGRRMGVYIGGRSHVRAAALDAVFAAPNPILGIGQNYLATNVSRFFNFTGPSLVVDTACSSGITGMALAADALRAGRIDMAIAGAVSLLQDPVAHELFSARNILSEDGRFRLFERQASGEVLGEGAGLVVLKRLDDAVRDGDRIRGVIRAIAVNNDGRTLGPGSPNMQSQRQVLREGLALAGLDPADIGYIEVNGGGSPVLDSIEIKILSEIYRLQDAALGRCHLGSIKPNVGHLLLTSGIASFIRCVLSLGERRIPPFLSAYEPFDFYDFSASRIVFNRESIDWTVPAGRRRLAAMSSFADGGTNCHVLIEEYPAERLAASARRPLPLPAMHRRDVSLASAPSAPRRPPAAAPVPATATSERQARTESDAAVNFWGRYVEKTV